jgi:peroxiredoxin (alkyl hydroperoxide reductase subunit C)
MPEAAQSFQPLPPGTTAPPFRLLKGDAAEQPPGSKILPEEWLSLDQCRGSPVVLVFYPADFTPVCGEELTIFSELMPELERHGARVFGVSVDSAWCHRAFARDRHLQVPLLADFHPKGEVSRRYHSYREQDGMSERALFVLDREGKVFWSYLSPIDVNPGVDGVLGALERLDGEQPGADVQPGQQPAGNPQQEESRP